MELHECKMGRMVMTEDLEVGHITGITYNIDMAHIGDMSASERLSRTIPVVTFPSGTRGIHPTNLTPFEK